MTPRLDSDGSPRARSRPGWTGSIGRATTWIVAGIAVAVGAVLAVITAAAMMVVALLAGLTMVMTSLVLRRRRGVAQPAASSSEPVIEARKVGDTWVTYGWERAGR